ncbi:light-harvesting complex 1 beta chain [Fulvimarina manganoxydans]|uniref:Light-harvesting complex 1 beta chain n=1 Tax=Fulvimarina manganoxydans TaxID=937218 RepID=A0A1W2EN67_9HYPH|nr:light-harvesting antenna LH1, beta subunit [Fulvimarina manganoxydans]MCK5931889.1 light-harvesting protein [Fulvimarina manganoxydans]MEE2950235.1 light-harvesting antenna LH1, beta subunit [Pseudomonadota bacterium]SMD11139.1 light-harvesting complex 1 beta chain [Fulvimarina manganoxydans]
MAETPMAGSEAGTLSGLTEREAQEFNSLFVTSFLAFTGVAVLAHFLVWLWRPWLQTPDTTAASLDLVQPLLSMIS